MESHVPGPDNDHCCIRGTGPAAPHCPDSALQRKHRLARPSGRGALAERPFGNDSLEPISDLRSPDDGSDCGSVADGFIGPIRLHMLRLVCGFLYKPRERSVRNYRQQEGGQAPPRTPPVRSRSLGPRPGTHFRIPEPGWIANRQTDTGRINAGGRHLLRPQTAYDDIAVQTGNRPQTACRDERNEIKDWRTGLSHLILIKGHRYLAPTTSFQLLIKGIWQLRIRQTA